MILNNFTLPCMSSYFLSSHTFHYLFDMIIYNIYDNEKAVCGGVWIIFG